MEAKHVNDFRPDDVLWEKFSKRLLRNPDRPLKNTDKRMVLRCRANPNLFRRSFEPYNQMLYHRMVLEPHTKSERYDQKVYKLPPPTPAHVLAETNKRPFEEQPGPSSKRNRVFITPVIRPPVAPVLIASPSTALVAPQPVSIPEPPVLTAPQILLQDPPRPPELTTPLVQIPDPPVQIPVFQPPVHISPVPTAPPVQIPDPPRPPELTTPIVQMPVFQPPVQISPVPTTPPVQLFLPDPPPVQVLLPDPPPVVETLEPTFMDDSSMDQIMASVFGDCSPQGILPAYTQEPQVLDTVPSLFDESNYPISFLDNFETGLAIEKQEDPMDWTIPRMKKKVKNTTGFKVIEPLDPSVRNCLPCIHLNLTWDKGFELRFFQVCRPPSHRVWEAHQLQTTDEYILDFADCTRVADVYVKWLMWLDDWEMHREDNVPWRMVGLQLWKRALEKHVQHSHEKALANGMPSDVTLLEHI
ncbi:hypothetical protein TNCV_2456231 [Trichonephila clavipes]|nr:hypothetical protein TNCV_2456231 [Trichonephila clavipes]